MGDRDKFINDLIKIKNNYGIKIAMDYVIAIRENKDNIKYLKEIMKDQSFTDFINAVEGNELETAIAILKGKKNLKGGVKKKKKSVKKKKPVRAKKQKKQKKPKKQSQIFVRFNKVPKPVSIYNTDFGAFSRNAVNNLPDNLVNEALEDARIENKKKKYEDLVQKYGFEVVRDMFVAGSDNKYNKRNFHPSSYGFDKDFGDAEKESNERKKKHNAKIREIRSISPYPEMLEGAPETYNFKGGRKKMKNLGHRINELQRSFNNLQRRIVDLQHRIGDARSGKHKNLGKKINDIQKQLGDIESELEDTNIVSATNYTNIKILERELGIIRSYINYKLNNNMHNSGYETETEQWDKHLKSMRNNSGQQSRRDTDALADASMYLETPRRFRGGNKKKKSRRKKKLRRKRTRRRRKKK